MSDDPTAEFTTSVWHDCWQCAGDGYVASCVSEYACIDPEEGCDLCQRRCDICRGKGGWFSPEPDEDG